MKEAAATIRRKALPPPSVRMLSRAEAAAYVGVSQNTFNKMIDDKLMPRAVPVYSRLLWDVHKLDLAIDALSEDDPANGETNEWDDA